MINCKLMSFCFLPKKIIKKLVLFFFLREKKLESQFYFCKFHFNSYIW